MITLHRPKKAPTILSGRGAKQAESDSSRFEASPDEYVSETQKFSDERFYSRKSVKNGPDDDASSQMLLL